MSKLYQALQQAKVDRPALRQLNFVHSTLATVVVSPGLETEMLGLYRALDNVFPGLHQKVILFLGAKGGEGTSTVVSGLARVASQHLNRKVAVLDADTLHPFQHRQFGVNPVIGWDDVLRGTQPAEKAFYLTNGDRLWVIPVSSARAGTVQVIDAPGIEVFFGTLRERFDLVLIDGAPATVLSDSIALSRKVDGVVLVIGAESTRWPVAKSVQQQIAHAGGRMLGAVLNKRRYYIPEFIYNRL
jgi:Mrp family chromosome partitioning ATPase